MSESKPAPPGGDSSQPGVATSNEHVKMDIDDAPDPDEDDLDDLDDMLEEFSAVKVDQNKKQEATSDLKSTSTSKPAAPTIPTLTNDVPIPGLEDFSDEDFQKQLQAGMAELMGDLDSNPEMQAQFENIFKELGTAAAVGSEPIAKDSAASSSSSKPAAKAPKDKDQIAAELSADATFQETIRKTMERMQASGEQATAAAAAEGSEDDFIAEMMKAMKDIPGSDGSEEDFSKMLMGMMEQLTNKEILYEPMRELNEKFPAWMEKNGPTLKDDDRKRYEEQQKLVKEMVGKFEEPTYKDENVADREYIVDRMQKMQAAGSPPPDLVGDMPSAKEVLDGPDDENCSPQ